MKVGNVKLTKKLKEDENVKIYIGKIEEIYFLVLHKLMIIFDFILGFFFRKYKEQLDKSQNSSFPGPDLEVSNNFYSYFYFDLFLYFWISFFFLLKIGISRNYIIQKIVFKFVNKQIF